MRSKQASLKKLRQAFTKNHVLQMQDLLTVLKVSSRVNVFRRLCHLDYISSFSHAGKYYTLKPIVQFDQDGLWFYKEIGFSQRGTLKNTLIKLVDERGEASTQKELENKLRVKVHNTLLDVVHSRLLRRKLINGLYVYASRNPKHAAIQIERYKQVLSGAVKAKTLPEWMVTEVLAEAIRASRMRVSQFDVTVRLKDRGITVTKIQIEEIFNRYGIKKTQV